MMMMMMMIMMMMMMMHFFSNFVINNFVLCMETVQNRLVDFKRFW